ncbi:hypothetical protein GQ44DRAFT_739820 [Phaeosphaeriaceae sp. PMI808]|nr:hypothetical protein GQ44DRAFT_739820 [Phaeosphaeriaceae sp. PMI808]
MLGILLGTLFTPSTLVLSSHYHFDLPLVSTQSGFFSFLGAVVQYGSFVPGATADVLGGTLILAYLLIRRVGEEHHQERTIWFSLGYVVVFFAVFTFPMFIIAILTQPTVLINPDTGTWVLIATLRVAAVSTSIAVNPAFSKPCVSAAATLTVPIWIPMFWVSVIMALHIKVINMFHCDSRSEMHALSSCAGLLVLSVMLESVQDAGCLVLGGLLIEMAKWRRCSSFWTFA